MSKGLFHHVEIYVSDLEKSIQFWGWLLEELGCSLYQGWEQGRSWKIDDTYIVFVQIEERFMDVAYHRCRTGLNHLAFHAESRQHINDIIGKLKDKGIPVLYPEQHPYAGGTKHYAVYFEDPDRIKVELVTP
ncbi:VOC family protein [Sporosarcina cascadiensis]|uniref:VOC family protein n=1 Tax=Sporosarcina cascadiensis TaxID=2660747 RepID=UPI00129A5D47|nr:VOC family protein [Sporosarcina cascadiensis]